MGGPIQRDKSFFFGYYEGFRQTTQTAQNLTIPANADLLDGVFRYAATDGVVRAVNVMQLSGLKLDPKLRADFLSKIPGASNVNNYDTGNSTATRVLNTAGYRFNADGSEQPGPVGFRVDYDCSRPATAVEGVYSYFKETDDRTDLDLVTPDATAGLHRTPIRSGSSLAWRWLNSAELPERAARRRESRARAVRERRGTYSSGILYNTALSITNPHRRQRHQYGIPAAGPLHEHLSDR